MKKRCVICGKLIGKSRLKHAPFADTCSGRCFVTVVIRLMPPWQLAMDQITINKATL